MQHVAEADNPFGRLLSRLQLTGAELLSRERAIAVFAPFVANFSLRTKDVGRERQDATMECRSTVATELGAVDQGEDGLYRSNFWSAGVVDTKPGARAAGVADGVCPLAIGGTPGSARHDPPPGGVLCVGWHGGRFGGVYVAGSALHGL